MQDIFEFIMMVCFGLSWPLSVYKSYKARTAAGKSLLFLLAVMVGYLSGITGKFVTGHINYVLIVYLFNLAMILSDIFLYFRNRSLDKKATAK